MEKESLASEQNNGSFAPEWTAWDNDGHYNVITHTLPFYSDTKILFDRKDILISGSNDVLCPPAISFDKKKIAFGVQKINYKEKRSHNYLFVSNTDGSDLQVVFEFSEDIAAFSLFYKIFGFSDNNTKVIYSLGKGEDTSKVKILSFDLLKKEKNDLCEIRVDSGVILSGSRDFLPDANRIVYGSRNGDIVILNISDCSQQIITQGENPMCSPDGQLIVFQKREGKNVFGDFYTITPEGLNKQLLLSQEKVRPHFVFEKIGYWIDRVISWSPDSRYVLFHRKIDPGRTDKKTPTLLLMDIETKAISSIPRSKVNTEDDTPIENPGLFDHI